MSNTTWTYAHTEEGPFLDATENTRECAVHEVLDYDDAGWIAETRPATLDDVNVKRAAEVAYDSFCEDLYQQVEGDLEETDGAFEITGLDELVALIQEWAKRHVKPKYPTFESGPEWVERKVEP
jgi:hypothetical protein